MIVSSSLPFQPLQIRTCDGKLHPIHKLQKNQKTGASLKNNRPSSFFTHRATALAAPTAALLGNRGDRTMYNSNGWVICSVKTSDYSSYGIGNRTTAYPAHYTFPFGSNILQFQRVFLS